MCSVGGPVYGSDVRNVRNPYDNKLIYWIDKIDEARNEIKDLQASINPFLVFWWGLEPLEQQILKLHLIERKSARITAEMIEINKNKVLDIKFVILKIWDKNLL